MYRYIGTLNGVPCYVVNKDWRTKFRDRGIATARSIIFRSPQDYWDLHLRDTLHAQHQRQRDLPRQVFTNLQRFLRPLYR